jgi:hypothetical protein
LRLPTVNLGEIEALLSAHSLVATAHAELQQAPDGAVKIVASVVPAASAYKVPQNLVTEYTGRETKPSRAWSCNSKPTRATPAPATKSMGSSAHGLNGISSRR